MDRRDADFEQARAQFAAGHFSEAATLCRDILQRQPRHAKALHMLARLLTDEGKTSEALACIEQARQLDLNHSSIRSACGRLLLDAGRTEEAISELQVAVKLDAGNIEAWHFLMAAFLRTGDLQKAENAARTALEHQPGAPGLLDDLGTVLAKRGDHAGAQACFEDALRQAPDDPGALGQLALWHEQNNRVDEAAGLLAKALARSPQDPFLCFVLGRCRRRQHQYAKAIAMFASLREVRAPALQKDVEFELALCRDAMQDADAAYDHMRRANALAAGLMPGAARKAEAFLAQTERLRACFAPAWVESWTQLPVDTNVVPPVFLLGFPRSGTTLLDTMLGAHAEVNVLEELPTLETVIAALNDRFGHYPEVLKGLSAESRGELREAYYAATGLRESNHVKRIVDKSPLYSMHVGLVQRLFPGAPILFMLRHPCDVVLSCFMTNFEINSSTAGFMQLGNTVNLYCAVMSLWRRYMEVLRPCCHQVRYEDLVSDRDGVLRGVTRFLGLDWTPEILDHGQHALERGRIRSASYAQVTRPLYADACGRWRHYWKYLEPYFEQLRPWCQHFGYAL